MNIKLAITKFIPDKIYLQMLYFKHFHRFINFRKPKTFNEKLQWLKLYDRRPEYTKLVDKYEVKKYVAEMIGEEYVIPTLGVWNSPEEIDFDSLPEQFVLKWNHDSGSIVICKDKRELNKEEAIKRLQKGKKYSGFWYGREWPYKNVKPKIIAEKYMYEKHQAVDKEVSKGLTDYKFYCFSGEAKCLYVSKGLGENHENAEMSFLDLNWNLMPFRREDFKPLNTIPPRPVSFEKMIDFANQLSAGHAFLRVDFYEIDGKLYFSELTFYPCSGLMRFNPTHWDMRFGEWIKISDVNRCE